jgi:hypothetical protein
MMTEQVLNNLIGRGTAHSSIPLIAQEMMRLSQALERQAHNLTSVHAAMLAGDGAESGPAQD